jgi:rhodanese-related sulfurtransferase
MVDVRSAREFRAEAVARAKNASLYLVPSTLPIGAVDWAMDERRGRDKLPPYNESFETQLRAALGGGDDVQSKMALLVCSNGQRSREACRLLAEDGYNSLRWVYGGLAAWLDAYTPRGVPRKRVVQGVFRDTGALMCVYAWLRCCASLTRPPAQLDGQRGGGYGAAGAGRQHNRPAGLKRFDAGVI